MFATIYLVNKDDVIIFNLISHSMQQTDKETHNSRSESISLNRKTILT